MAVQSKIDHKEIMEIYDALVCSNSEYTKMLDKIASLASGRILEVGVGTGLLTEKLIVKSEISDLTLIEPSTDFIRRFKEKFPDVNIQQEDGFEHHNDCPYDSIIMSLVYHHIPDEQKLGFVQSMYQNLRYGGKLVIGDVFILPYQNEEQRDQRLRRFHNIRIRSQTNPQFREVERKSLEDGLRRDGEWKTSYTILEAQLRQVGFRNSNAEDIGPQDTGGYKVITAIK